MDKSCMYWGFSAGNGWFDLIDTLAERLQFWADRRAPLAFWVEIIVFQRSPKLE
jgi:hypothetical protein